MVSHTSPSSWEVSNRSDNLPTFVLASHFEKHFPTLWSEGKEEQYSLATIYHIGGEYPRLKEQGLELC